MLNNELSKAKKLWLNGNWKALADICLETTNGHLDTADLAIFKAAGYQQLNDINNCKKYATIAKQLNCNSKLLSKILIAGVHNILGRINALKENNKKIQYHFNEAINIVAPEKKSNLNTHMRTVSEVAKLGLLPQAAELIIQEQKHVKSLLNRPSNNEATIKILMSEVEILTHELQLAHQKSQLYSSSNQNETVFYNNGAVNVERLKQLSPSQLGQDLWVLKQTNYKKNGFFVEFGATDGILLSNSYLLEKEFGWQGLCAEPNPKFFTQLQHNRNCTVTNACIAAETGKRVQFILANEFGGIADYANNDQHADKRAAYLAEGNIIQLSTVCLHDFLLENKAPKKIDYMSIDTEGSEYNILATFPFQKWNIELLSIEHNFTESRENIRKLLASFGYKCVESKWDDWFYKN